MKQDQLAQAIIDLSDLVSRLRGPGGCPWDREQTDSTVKMYLIEEAYEVLHAIENGTSANVREELGDLLFQIIFLADLARVREEFDMVEVMEQVKQKMIRRHPHVFGKAQIDSSEEVSKRWKEIKKTEKGSSGNIHLSVEAVPVDLPALMRAHRLSERATEPDDDLKHGATIWEEVDKGFKDLKRAVAEKDREQIGNVLGEILFSLANLGRHFGFNAENVLRNANKKFIESHCSPK